MTEDLDVPIANRHPHVDEAADWRDRRSNTDLVTKLWHDKDGDFGAHTRFGFGWGPVEIVRAVRDDAVRTVEVLVAGEAVAMIRVHDESDDVEVGTRAPKGFSGSHEPYVLSESQGPEDMGTHDSPAVSYVLDCLLTLSNSLQEDLTEQRRVKKYVPRSTIDALDQIHVLLTSIQ